MGADVCSPQALAPRCHSKEVLGVPETLLGLGYRVLFTSGWPPLTGSVRSENTEVPGGKPEADGAKTGCFPGGELAL